MTREWLEQKQIGIYVAVLIIAGIAGIAMPETGQALNKAISPLLAVLLYAMFVQIPFLQLRGPLLTRKFVGALLVSNFAVAPPLVWLLTQIWPQPPYVLAGLFLVLLAPCIDYVIVFTQLGRGNERLMLAATPLLFLVQMALLPLYLRLFLGADAAQLVQPEPFIEAFGYLIALPFAGALATQLWAKRSTAGQTASNITAWLPVPMMGLVLFAVVCSQFGAIVDDYKVIAQVVPLYVAFHLIMPVLSRFVGSCFRLDAGAGRAVVFSASTRNSLVVLPLALALPDEWSAAVSAIIVTQTIVELAAECIYIRAVPLLLWRDNRHAK